MPRNLIDADLKEWEVFATTGRQGFSDPARVAFRCTSDPTERARTVDIEGDKSEAEAMVAGRSDEELRKLMARSRALD